MPYVSVHIAASEVLEDLDDEDIQKEMERRERAKAPTGSKPVADTQLLEQIWRHYRDRDDAPQCLREYIWRTLGKVI